MRVSTSSKKKRRRLGTVREWVSRKEKEGVPWEVGDKLLKEMDTWLPQIVLGLTNMPLVG